MLRPEDDRAIEDLFERLRNVEHQSGPRDAEAEALIFQHLRNNPAAAYYMAQTIVVQEAALREQQQRIAELEAEAERNSGGFLGSIFGNDRPQQRVPRRAGPWERPAEGGFLAGAAQTALGVTGGVLLGSAIAGMFSSPAEAGEVPATGLDESGSSEGFDGGDDWGGGFDIGGDF